ncbi:MAG: SMC-Scp complex subunit ScpB [Christensenellaceae bacterium]|jgi:chromosome segregation and condensation protein ScpB|nr:SMC-Scp complex subunit ScpB [Christensenellaceae bacterium]
MEEQKQTDIFDNAAEALAAEALAAETAALRKTEEKSQGEKAQKIITSTVEAILFAAGESIEKSKLIRGELTEGEGAIATTQQIEPAIAELKAKYSGESAILIREFNNKLQFMTNSAYGDAVLRVVKGLTNEKTLTERGVKVLAVIAYGAENMKAVHKGITRGEVANMLDFDPNYYITMLRDMQLIESVQEWYGGAHCYDVTENFLKRFNLSSRYELADYESAMIRFNTIAEKERIKEENAKRELEEIRQRREEEEKIAHEQEKKERAEKKGKGKKSGYE